jgi:hypothetical protein
MAFISIPQAWIASGKFVVQSLMQYIKDDLDALYSAIAGTTVTDVPNGSFEIDSDTDGVPDNWTQNLLPGGSATLDATDQASAGISLKFTHPGGAGNGGGYYDSGYVPCTPLRNLIIGWALKSSIAAIHNAVDVRWYDKSHVYISTTNLYDEAAACPTDWTQMTGWALPPSTARYFKVRVTGGAVDVSNAGTTRFDDVFIVKNAPIFAAGEITGLTYNDGNPLTLYVNTGLKDIMPSVDGASPFGFRAAVQVSHGSWTPGHNKVFFAVETSLFLVSGFETSLGQSATWQSITWHKWDVGLKITLTPIFYTDNTDIVTGIHWMVVKDA